MDSNDFKGSVVMMGNLGLDQSKLVVINRIVEWIMVFYRDWNDKKLRKSEVIFKLFELSKKAMNATGDRDLNVVREDLLKITEKYPG